MSMTDKQAEAVDNIDDYGSVHPFPQKGKKKQKSQLKMPQAPGSGVTANYSNDLL